MTGRHAAVVALATIALVAAGPSRTQAAAVGGLPFLPLGHDRVATCLAAPGGGRVALTDTPPFSVRGVQLLRAAPSGELAPDGAVPLGRMFDCPRTAVAADGSAVVAGQFGGEDLRIAVRDAGGAFGAPARIDLPEDAFVADGDVAVAVAPGGAAAVAWTELLHDRERVRVVRRPAGGAFGAVETAVAGPAQELPAAVAVDPSGTTTLAWSREAGGARNVVGLTSAAPGRPFRAPDRLPAAGRDSQALALATAPDGGLLLVDAASGAVRIFDRAPGAAVLRAGPVLRPPAGAPLVEGPPVAALAPGGAAAVVWEVVSGRGRREVRVALRAPGAAFSAPVSLPGAGTTALDLARDPVEGASLAAAVADDGRVIVGWLAAARFGRDRLVRAWAATGTAGAGLGAPAPVSSPGRSATGVAAAASPLGLLWADDRPAPGIDGDRFPQGDGRLHRALAGLPPAPSPPAPRLGVTARPQRIHREDRVVVRAHCSAACDLRAVAPPPRAAIATGQLRGAGTRTLRLAAIADATPLARRDRRPLQVVVRATAPGGLAVAERRIAVPLRRARTAPPRPPRDVRLVRHGDRLIVTFRTGRPALRERFVVRAKGPGPGGFLDQSSADGRGRTRFRIVTTSARATDRIVLVWRSTEPGLTGGHLRLPVP